VGDHLGVDVGPLRGDERTDVTVPEPVDRVIVPVLRRTFLRGWLGGGRIEKVGPRTEPALAGTRVAVLLEDAYADYVVADAGRLAGVPEGLGAAAASMLPTVGAVALGALRTGRLGQADTVLITAGAGAIGHLAVQLARQQGAGTVIATAGSPGKLAFLKELGADVAVDHTQPDWSDQVRLAAPGGLDVSLLSWRAADPEQARTDIAGLTGLLETGQLHIAATALPLAEAVQAHRLLEDRTVIGRLILLP
jgi:NADPH:quinone reductase